ncbi:hypothetical protein V5738_17515 [Salinisphaera sp. SPP-AMP-43]|uniref:hypothetical protein n=1 Tax=Salinisphaera sp. SPP-AMP-43 TaxID=3121288 RepID=UPI003C6E9B93
MTMKTLFAIYFLALLLMAVFPPFYLAVSGSQILVLGIPLPFFYWILIAALLCLGVALLYCYEQARGEIPEDEQS